MKKPITVEAEQQTRYTGCAQPAQSVQLAQRTRSDATNSFFTARKPDFTDNRTETLAQRRMIADINASPRTVAQRKEAVSIHASPRMIAQRKLYGSIGNPAPGLQNASMKKFMQGRFGTMQRGEKNNPGHGQLKQLNLTIQNDAVQRVIELDGVVADKGQLQDKVADKAEKDIIANWGQSEIVHKFKTNRTKNAEENLETAINNAKKQAVDVPALFSAANLKFLTQAEDRLPTLYFKQNNDSGRLRQQHGSGPGVFTESNKTDYFFPDKDNKQKFAEKARSAMKKTVFNPDLIEFKAVTIPTQGYEHYEVTYNNNGVPIKVHPSGGTVETNLNGYGDLQIKAIYQRIIGFTP